MSTHEIEKALEIWTLQNLVNFSILMGILAFGLSLIQQYYRGIEQKLTLRVSIEIWNALTIIIVDVFLVMVVLIGLIVLNPDIMSDIKIALPFYPVAVILFTVALFLRLFYQGHQVAHPTFLRVTYLMFAANLINVIGFAFVMEAPSGEYLAVHPSPFWTFLKTYLRSNARPHGLELAQITFYICFPILILIFLWGFKSALNSLKKER